MPVRSSSWTSSSAEAMSEQSRACDRSVLDTEGDSGLQDDTMVYDKVGSAMEVWACGDVAVVGKPWIVSPRR